jgi:GTPase SAR1 family protein
MSNDVASDVDLDNKLEANQILFSGAYSKSQIIPTLKLIADEPEYYSELFGYSEYSDRLYNLMKDSLPDKPFAICLHGKPGDGKTSLLHRIYNKFQQDSPTRDTQAIWFDAWNYERLEPAFIIMTKILNTYPNKTEAREKVLGILRSLSLLYYGANLESRSENAQTVQDIRLKEIVDDLDEVSKNIDKIIGSGKLFIFIDHLDRCKPDTINEVLRSISMHFSSSKIRFIVGADMEKLENSSQSGLRTKVSSADEDTRIDKVFQLRLAMPEKDAKMMEEYIEKLCVLFPPEIKRFLAQSLPRNPRQAKEAVNLAFYVSSIASEDEFGTVLPYILIWSILSTSFYRLSRLIREDPEVLLDLSILTAQTRDFASFSDIMGMTEGDEKLFRINMNIAIGSVSPLAIELCRSHVMRNKALYDFLKSINKPLRLDEQSRSERADGLKRSLRYVSLAS